MPEGNDTKPKGDESRSNAVPASQSAAQTPQTSVGQRESQDRTEHTKKTHIYPRIGCNSPCDGHNDTDNNRCP